MFPGENGWDGIRAEVDELQGTEDGRWTAQLKPYAALSLVFVLKQLMLLIRNI